MQGAWVRSLVKELDPACHNYKIPHAATKDPARGNEDPVCHN